jgi:hypothetical protein
LKYLIRIALIGGPIVGTALMWFFAITPLWEHYLKGETAPGAGIGNIHTWLNNFFAVLTVVLALLCLVAVYCAFLYATYVFQMYRKRVDRKHFSVELFTYAFYGLVLYAAAAAVIAYVVIPMYAAGSHLVKVAYVAGSNAIAISDTNNGNDLQGLAVMLGLCAFGMLLWGVLFTYRSFDEWRTINQRRYMPW